MRHLSGTVAVEEGGVTKEVWQQFVFDAGVEDEEPQQIFDGEY